MRHFRLQRNQQFEPTVNLEKLWSLVSEQTRSNAQASKDNKAAVIDVTKAVIYYFISFCVLGLFQGPRQGHSPQDPRDRQGQALLQDR